MWQCGTILEHEVKRDHADELINLELLPRLSTALVVFDELVPFGSLGED